MVIVIYFFLEKSSEEILLEYNPKNGDMLVTRDGCWSFFEENGLSHSDIQELIRWWIMRIYHIEISVIDSVTGWIVWNHIIIKYND